jgi:hypothetical protein
VSSALNFREDGQVFPDFLLYPFFTNIETVTKNDAKRGRMLQLREFSHIHHPSRVKILAENIRRGISVITAFQNFLLSL